MAGEIPLISPLPDAPQRGLTSKTEFRNKADKFVAALPGFQVETNALAEALGALGQRVDTKTAIVEQKAIEVSEAAGTIDQKIADGTASAVISLNQKIDNAKVDINTTAATAKTDIETAASAAKTDAVDTFNQLSVVATTAKDEVLASLATTRDQILEAKDSAITTVEQKKTEATLNIEENRAIVEALVDNTLVTLLVSKWLVSKDYAEGNVVYSPLSQKTYRAKVATAKDTGVDPSMDEEKWKVLDGISAADVDNTALSYALSMQYALKTAFVYATNNTAYGVQMAILTGLRDKKII